MEIEEVIVSSNTLTFKEYVELRLLAFALWVTNKGIVYDPILKFLRQNKIDAFELFNRIHKNLEFAPSSIKQIFKEFENATIKELWDSPEVIGECVGYRGN